MNSVQKFFQYLDIEDKSITKEQIFDLIKLGGQSILNDLEVDLFPLEEAVILWYINKLEQGQIFEQDIINIFN